MSNSPLVQYTRISPNSNNPRNHVIDTITIHHTGGVISVESLGDIFANPGRQASSNYGIGCDGRIAMFVEEQNRSWCSSSWENDHRAITIEVSNCQNGGNWPVSDYVLSRLIELCVDICKRNGIKRLNFTGDTTGNLTMHKWFASTECPGPYLESKFPYIAEEVNKRLEPIELKYEEIPRKSVKLKIDTNLWNLHFDKWHNAECVKSFTAGTQIDNIVAIATHPLGGKYYITEYSYSNHIDNGFNVVDCEDIAPEPIEVSTEPPIEEPNNSDSEPKEDDNTNTPTEPIVDDKPKENLIKWFAKLIVEFIKKVINYKTKK